MQRPSDKGRPADDRAVYVISVAAELAGVHPQTLRVYERRGLLRPARTRGRARRYSPRDIAHAQLIQTLTQDHGMNLAGVEMVMELRRELDRVREEVDNLRSEMLRAKRRLEEEVEQVHRSYRADLVPVRNAIVRFRASDRGERPRR